MLSMFIFTSLTVYLIILVYISGVLVLMLYFSMLMSNMSLVLKMHWAILLMVPTTITLFDSGLELFSMTGLLAPAMKSSFVLLLLIFVGILLIISMIFSFSKNIRFT